MRHVQLYLSQEQEDVLAQLDERNVDYVRTPTVDGDGELVQFPLPDEAVDDVLRELSDRGLSNEAYTVVDESTTATAPNLDQLQTTFADELSGELAGEHLHDHAAELNPNWITFIGMAFLSAVIVAGGLLRNSAAAVAGAMVIAPYFGTALSISTGIVANDEFLFLDGIKHLAVGLLVSVAGAAGVGVIGQALDLVPSTLALTHLEQVTIFLTPTLLSVGIAFAAGIAGAISFATSTNVGLSGVAIAAAIVPAAGVVGLGIAWAAPSLVVGATALLIVNVVTINAVAIPVLYAFDGRASLTFTPWQSVGTTLSRPRVLAVLFAIAVIVAGGGVATVQHASFNRTVTDVVDDVLTQPEYDELAIESLHVEYAGPLDAPGPALVRISVVNGEASAYPHLASVLERRIERAAEQEVTVYVRFTAYTQGENASPGDPAPTGA